jgi:hypothetical protein
MLQPVRAKSLRCRGRFLMTNKSSFAPPVWHASR